MALGTLDWHMVSPYTGVPVPVHTVSSPPSTGRGGAQGGPAAPGRMGGASGCISGITGDPGSYLGGDRQLSGDTGGY